MCKLYCLNHLHLIKFTKVDELSQILLYMLYHKSTYTRLLKLIQCSQCQINKQLCTARQNGLVEVKLYALSRCDLKIVSDI